MLDASDTNPPKFILSIGPVGKREGGKGYGDDYARLLMNLDDMQAPTSLIRKEEAASFLFP